MDIIAGNKWWSSEESKWCGGWESKTFVCAGGGLQRRKLKIWFGWWKSNCVGLSKCPASYLSNSEVSEIPSAISSDLIDNETNVSKIKVACSNWCDSREVENPGTVLLY